MNQHAQHAHQQPEQPLPQQQFTPAPPPKKKRTGLKITLGVVAGIVVVAAFASGGQDDGGDGGDGGRAEAGDSAAAAPAEDKAKDQPKAAEAADAGSEKSQAEQFKAHVAKKGTPQQKEAVQHVTDVQGADKRNDVMDSAEIHTDYTGGMTGPHTGDGKLLASAFAGWRSSDNGLVTVYDADGEILSNGNY
ncbi:hypothetical protein [Streptomyces cacaoi]